MAADIARSNTRPDRIVDGVKNHHGYSEYPVRSTEAMEMEKAFIDDYPRRVSLGVRTKNRLQYQVTEKNALQIMIPNTDLINHTPPFPQYSLGLAI